MTDIPDFTPLLRRIAEAVRRIAQSRKMEEEVRARAESHRDLRPKNPEPALKSSDAA